MGFLRFHGRPPVASGREALPHPLGRAQGPGPPVDIAVGRSHELGQVELTRDARDPREAKVNAGTGVDPEDEVAALGPRDGPGRDPGLQIAVGHEALGSTLGRSLHSRGPQWLLRAESGVAA